MWTFLCKDCQSKSFVATKGSQKGKLNVPCKVNHLLTPNNSWLKFLWCISLLPPSRSINSFDEICIGEGFRNLSWSVWRHAMDFMLANSEETSKLWRPFHHPNASMRWFSYCNKTHYCYHLWQQEFSMSLIQLKYVMHTGQPECPLESEWKQSAFKL